jgi:excisionase family DNA binding protein
MEVYTIKEAARKTKIGMETLRRACEEGLIKASKLPNREWRIAESGAPHRR